MRAQSLAEYKIRFPLKELAGEDLRVGWPPRVASDIRLCASTLLFGSNWSFIRGWIERYGIN
jgi:hypothetical protein